jgi:hypothetical protein
MSTVLVRLDLVEEYYASKLSRQEFRDKKAGQGVHLSKTRFRQWIEDYKSGRLTRSVTNIYRIPKAGKSLEETISIIRIKTFCYLICFYRFNHLAENSFVL